MIIGQGEAGVQEVRMSELVFDRSGNAESVGMADDVMDEVSRCFELIGEIDGKKEDFMRMMSGLEGIILRWWRSGFQSIIEFYHQKWGRVTFDEIYR